MFQKSGYAAAARSTGMPRDIEYHAFSRVTGKIRRAIETDAPLGVLGEALTENLTLWRTIAIDIAAPENGLPAQLRAQLFFLFEFTSAHTPKVLKGEADVEALLDINRAIMQGLRPNSTVQEAH